MSDLGERLKEERYRNNMTQRMICDKSGIGTATYSRYEAGYRNPDSDFLQWLHGNGFDIHYILTGTRISSALEGQNIYEAPEQALYAVLDAQERLGIVLSPDSLKSALGYAYTAQIDEDGIYDFIKAAYSVLGKELKNKEDTE